MGQRLERAFAEQEGPVGPTILVGGAIWGLVTVVLLFMLLGAVHDTETNAGEVGDNLTAITKSTKDASLATTLNTTAKQIFTAVEPLEPSLATTSQSADQLEAVTKQLLGDVVVIQRESGETLASVESATALANSLVGTSDAIARYAAAVRSSSENTAGKADVAANNIDFTQALSNSIERQMLTVVKDVADLAAHAKRNDARGGPGP